MAKQQQVNNKSQKITNHALTISTNKTNTYTINVQNSVDVAKNIVTSTELLDENQKPIKCKKPKESIMFNGDKVFFVEKTKILGVTIDNHL